MRYGFAIGCVCLTTSMLWAQAGGDQPAQGETMTNPRVKLETTLGDIVIELDANKAPISTQNFLRYAEEGYYEGTVFHRVMKEFMIQGGGFTAEMDQKSAGLHEGIILESQNGLKNVPGTIAMARTADPNSATSQFFINVVDNVSKLDYPGRDGFGYTVFGKVVEGMENVEKIRQTECVVHPKYKTRDGAVTPKEAVVIKSAKVVQDTDRAKLKTSTDAALQAYNDLLPNYMKKTESETGKKFEKTASGLMWLSMKDGTGDKTPAPTDTVEVHYTGWRVDGFEFDSSMKQGGQPIKFSLNGVIKGWTEGIGMMKVGEKRRLIIPSELAYGQRGTPPFIPPNATLIFDVELLSIQSANTPSPAGGQ